MRNYKPLYETEFYGKEIDKVEFAVYKKETEVKLSHKDTVNRILKCMEDNKDIIDDADQEIFNKILGDHQILDKIVFVSDGSWRNHRIWFQQGFFITECDEMGYTIDYYYHNLPNKDKLNYLKNNYEFIFIQITDAMFYDDDLLSGSDYDNHYSEAYYPECEFD